MLTATVLTLQATPDAQIAPNLGRATHAWFLDQVRRHDPSLADLLHEPNQEHPFTVSNLWRGRADADGTYFLRFTSYIPELSTLLTEQILPNLPTRLLLGHAPVQVQAIATTPDAHPAAGTTTFAALMQEQTLAARLAPFVTLRFVSPTAFHSNDLFLPLPLPRLVFEGLLRRWNATAPATLPAELSRFAEECVAISRHELHSERISFGDAQQHGAFPGFVGTASYAFRVTDRYWMGLIHLLAAFAFYTGVGLRTTMGLGQTRKLA